MTSASKGSAGRPPKGAAKRTNRLTIHLSDDEKKQLQEAADAAGLPLAYLVRLRALDSVAREPRERSTAMTA